MYITYGNRKVAKKKNLKVKPMGNVKNAIGSRENSRKKDKYW